MFKKIIHFLKPLVRNYYLVAGLAFIIWMIFADSNNLITQFRNRRELRNLMQQKQFYENEISRNKTLVRDLTDPKDTRALEKFGREKYLMKRPNEEIFLIVREGDKKD